MQLRARLVRDGFWKNEFLAECEPMARLAFIGLWCLADREGRLEDRPGLIKAQIFPHDDLDIEELLAQLLERKFIVRYVVDGERYMAIPKFRQHQWVHPNEKKSKIPPCDGQSEITQPEPVKRIAAKASGSTDGFDEFWAIYPRKTAKTVAIKAWKKVKVDAALLGIILEAVKRQKDTKQWQDGFIPHPATWLNQKRWEDEVGHDQGQRSGGSVGHPGRVRAPAGKYDNVGTTAQPFTPAAVPAPGENGQLPPSGGPPSEPDRP